MENTEYQELLTANHVGANYEWAWRCNLIVGCPGCEIRDICWARRTFKRFKETHWLRNNGNFDKPIFYPLALKALRHKKTRFYLNGMGDPFAKGSQLLKVVYVKNGFYYIGTWGVIHRFLTDNPQSNLVLLTKFPENIPDDLPDIPNLWIGVSVNNQENANRRIEILLNRNYNIKKVVSVEPLLSEINLETGSYGYLSGWTTGSEPDPYDGSEVRVQVQTPSIDWVILGGESGNRVYPSHIDDIRRSYVNEIVGDCESCGIPLFMKSNLRKMPSNYVRQFPEVQVGK